MRSLSRNRYFFIDLILPTTFTNINFYILLILGIRAFRLQDPVMGSFCMLSQIKYEAELCGFYGNLKYLKFCILSLLERPLIFGGYIVLKF